MDKSIGDLYNRTIGYSSIESVDASKMLRLILVIKRLLDHFKLEVGTKVLVAGAGSGVEAVLIRDVFQVETIGVDINISDQSTPQGNPIVYLLNQNIAKLGFENDSFSFVYCYHVLEHVTDPIIVLGELSRVLSPGRLAFIGFPNKNRMFSYIGTSQNESLFTKIKWNLNDYRFRLMGKFENKLGAHAGFTEREFLAFAKLIFQEVTPVRNTYMKLKYPGINWLLNIIEKLGLAEYVYPSNYFICKKGLNE
jgi:ubiquinone/menaquinone biosynthesis C-methylase UbiE